MAKGTGFAEDIPVKLDPLPFATNPEMSHTVTTQGFRLILFWAKLVGEADQRGPARKHTALVLAHPTPRPKNEFSRASRQSGTCPLQTQGKRRNTAAVTEAAQALTKEHQERDQTVRSLNDAEPCCKNLLRHVRSEQMGVSGHLHAVSQSGYSIQIKNYECCAPSVEYSSGPQHISGQEIDGRLPGGRIGRKIIEHQLFIEE